jgi:hypothetical protein
MDRLIKVLACAQGDRPALSLLSFYIAELLVLEHCLNSQESGTTAVILFAHRLCSADRSLGCCAGRSFLLL